MIKPVIACLFSVAACIAVSAQYDVRKFGAKGNGLQLDTRAIQQAVDSASGNNGGIVYFPAGVYRIGTVMLKSNVELQLMPGSTIIGSENVNDYKVVHQKYESRTRDLYAKYFMFYAENETNISITGKGVVDGNGLKHFQEERPQNVRPFMMRFVNCSQIVLRDISLIESANWTLHLLACSNVNIDGINVVTTAEGNRDGIDIDACRNVTISNCYVSTTDDAIVMKATSDDICSDVAITNCVLSSKGSAIKTGTESNGGFKNIVVSNCVIKNIPIHAGIELMTVDGGVMQNILIQNIAMENVATPFFIRVGARARPYKLRQYVQRIGNVADISLNNINVLNARLPSSIIGLPNKKLINISVAGYTARYIEFQAGSAYNKVPLFEFDYPAANMFSNLPAFGIYSRDVSGLLLRDVKLFASGNGEMRPGLVFDRVDKMRLYAVEATQLNVNSPVNLDNYDAKNISNRSDKFVSRPINIPMTMKKGEAQLCLLVRNAKPGIAKLSITYNGIVQEFEVDWQQWGWAPISLLRQFSEGEKTNITIQQTDKAASLQVGKYFIRSVNNGYTD